MTIAELIADKFAAQLDPARVTPTQNMVLNAIKAEALRRGRREEWRRQASAKKAGDQARGHGGPR